MNSQQTFLIFDLDSNGHHASYIDFLSEYIVKINPEISLKIIVSPDFKTRHSQIVSKNNSLKIEWVFIDAEQDSILNSKKSVLQNSFYQWDLFCKFCKQFKANHAILMYFDLFQFAAILKQNPICDFSGIYFRPTLVNYKAESFKEKINFFRKEITLRILLKNRKLKNLFCLDSFATTCMQEKWNAQKVKYLPDPVKNFPNQGFDKTSFKKELGIEESRKVFLVFGHLDARKSIDKIAEAVLELESIQQQQITLLLVGKWAEYEKLKYNHLLIKNDYIQIINIDYFIDENEIQHYFKISDVVLALYQKHIGMSGILNRAALAQRPVFCYDYGLMAALVKEYEMGILIKDNNGLQNAFEATINDKNPKVNPSKLGLFSSKNTPDSYAKTIIEACFKA